MSERFYIHCGDDINKQLMDTESDFNIHIDEIYSDEELIQLCNLLNGLNDENKELKYKLRNCEDARKSYKQDWKACSSYCDEYKNEIISLKDEVEGLIGENKEFKKENEQLRKKLEQIYSFKGLNCRCVNGV